VGDTAPQNMPTYMYSVITGCVLGCESVFIHELGHNMGNKHDRNTVVWQAWSSPQGGGAYPYSYGYAYCNSGSLTCNPLTNPANPGGCASQPECSTNDLTNFADIMAYFQGTAQKIYKFSNPNITCAAPGGDGVPRPCGIIDTDPNSANTALSMNNNRVALSSIKGSVSGANLPGSLQFTTLATAALESAGSITFNVSRLGGSAGAVSASYATQNGSAIAGLDYVASSGNVSWTNGDSANKTIVVPLIANGAATNGTTFSVTLSNPTGAAGVFLGFPSTTTGIIQEPWPPGGTMPAGFTTTGGLPWTTATDQVYEGTTSLRSAQPISSSLGTYNDSELFYTATFGAGTLAFAYRVSSWQNAGYFPYGLMDFSVDGTVVMSDGGETGWKYFTYTLSAGNHTLRWRYRNALTAPCSAGWNPPAPAGAACADRAWIDALVLPAPRASSVKSRKTHGGAGTFDQTIDTTALIGGAITVEPRSAGASHVLVHQFDATVATPGVAVCIDQSAAPIGSATPAAVGSTVEVTVTGIPDNKRVTCTLSNVNGIGGNVAASVGFLAGDVNGSRSVTASDILATKGKAGQPVATNFKYDIDRNGTIDANDVAAVKANAGLSMP
jgi:hypothetical protein